MRYIQNSSDYQLHITVESTDSPVTDPELIRDELTDQSRYIKPAHKSSRSMWPEEELIGVSIDGPDGLSGKITNRKFKLSVDEYENFGEAYEKLKHWLADTRIELPQKNSFKVTGFTFLSSEDQVVATYDTTKTEEVDELFGHIYESGGIRSNYSMIQGMVTFTFIEPNDGVSFNKFEDYLESIINKELVIVGAEEDIIESED